VMATGFQKHAPSNLRLQRTTAASDLGNGASRRRGTTAVAAEAQMRWAASRTSVTFYSLTALAVVLLGGCSFWAAGDDPRGREVRAAGSQLVAALERHRVTHGSYPPSLQELGVAGTGSSDAMYQRQEDTYLLFLTYAPTWPQTGLVSCAFTKADPNGKCHGYW